LDWQLTELDYHTLKRGQALLDRNLRNAGIGCIEHQFYESTRAGLIHGERHHLGTTRMHRDVRHGVVNANARVHSLDNLYIAGSSVFPTAGFANPSLTVVAMSIRLAEHLKKCFRGGCE
jgi:choline dehydrogenase-like flavoprotein